MRSLRALLFTMAIAGAIVGSPEPEPVPPPRPPVEVVVPGRPYAITAGYGAIWVLTETEVVRVNRDTAAIEARIPLGVAGFSGDGFTDPLGAIAAGNGAIWVATRTQGEPPGTVRGRRGPGIPGVYDPSGESLPEDIPDVPGALVRIDPRTSAVTPTPLPPGRAFDVTCGGGRVWVMAGRALIAFEDGREVAQREIEQEARLAHDGTSLWVAGRETLLRLDARLRDEMPPIVGGAYDVATGGGRAWFARADAVGLVRFEGGRPRTIDGTPTAALAAGGGLVWAADQDRGGAIRLDPVSGREISIHPAPGRRIGAIAADGDELWMIGAEGAVGRISV